jgi:hypothetical protein
MNCFYIQQSYRISSKRLGPCLALLLKYFLKYLENTLVYTNTKVLNTLRCLDAINTMVLKLKYYPKIQIF